MRSRIAVLVVATTVATAATAATVALPANAMQASPVRFATVQYDSPGSDTGSNRSLNDEWISLKNSGRTAKDLTGWTLRDPEGHVYRFPQFRLRPGKTVTVHTGSGSNTGAHLYWGEGWYVWNNSGDRAILKNRAGTRIDVCNWDDGDGTTSC